MGYLSEPIYNARTPREYLEKVDEIRMKEALLTGFKTECLRCYSSNIRFNTSFDYDDEPVVKIICDNCNQEEFV